ncbi:ParA family protein [Streptomyces sp. SM12]|uniref:ParA family protein n=1 Tax=Streptomyces sp. SM12 TaxID=1071602 RepID=UPI0015E186DA|nr:ParA family protein [Streptomyces sp. SM12]
MTNQAGGAGKTTSAVNIAACAAEFGHEVLVVGTDAQCDASVLLGYDTDELDNTATLHDVLIEAASIQDAIVPASAGPVGEEDSRQIPNLYLVPESAELEDAEQILTRRLAREMWLRNTLAPIRYKWDLIIIDCPGNLGLVSVNAIAAADEVVACVKPGAKELRAMTRMEAKVDQINTAFAANGAKAELSHVLLVDVPTTRSQGAVYADSAEQAREAYGAMVLPSVRRSPRIAEAYSYQMPMSYYDRTAPVTADFYAVTKALGITRRR